MELNPGYLHIEQPWKYDMETCRPTYPRRPIQPGISFRGGTVLHSNAVPTNLSRIHDAIAEPMIEVEACAVGRPCVPTFGVRDVFVPWRHDEQILDVTPCQLGTEQNSITFLSLRMWHREINISRTCNIPFVSLRILSNATSRILSSCTHVYTCIYLFIHTRGFVSTFLEGGGKIFFYFSMPPDYWKIEKDQHLYM